MRRILGLTLLLLAITVPLALAAGTPTDGTLSVKRGRGAVTLKVTGTIIVRVSNGRIQVRDFRPYDGNDPQFSCKPAQRHRISRQVTYCKGRNLGVRVETVASPSASGAAGSRSRQWRTGRWTSTARATPA
jgi:hypothetical protein